MVAAVVGVGQRIVHWDCWNSLAHWRDNEVAAGRMTVPWHRWPFPCLLVQRWRRGADNGALAALAIPSLLAQGQVQGGIDDGALAFIRNPDSADRNHSTSTLLFQGGFPPRKQFGNF